MSREQPAGTSDTHRRLFQDNAKGRFRVPYGTNRHKHSQAVISLLVFIGAVLVGAAYYGAVQVSDPTSDILGLLRAVPVVLVAVGTFVIAGMSLYYLVEQRHFSDTSAVQGKGSILPSANIASVKRQMSVGKRARGVAIKRSVAMQRMFEHQIASEVDFTLPDDVSFASLLVFHREVTTSLRELIVFAEQQSNRVRQRGPSKRASHAVRVLSADQAIGEVESVAARVRTMGALLYQVSEKTGAHWAWTGDLARPGMYQPLQPIVLPSHSNKKLTPDQLRRLAHGILNLDKHLIFRANYALHFAKVDIDFDDVVSLLRQYYELTYELLDRTKALRNIIYEQYSGKYSRVQVP